MHATGPVLQIVNAWDASSARMLAAGGSTRVGTTSFGVAFAHGYPDGEQIPWETTCAVAAAVVDAVDVPVTIDIEAGRGDTADAVGRSVAEIVETGAVGVNIEDSVPGRTGELFPMEVQASRYAAARRASDAAGVPLFINREVRRVLRCRHRPGGPRPTRSSTAPRPTRRRAPTGSSPRAPRSAHADHDHAVGRPARQRHTQRNTVSGEMLSRLQASKLRTMSVNNPSFECRHLR